MVYQGLQPKSTKIHQNHHHQAKIDLEIAGSPLRRPENNGFGHHAICCQVLICLNYDFIEFGAMDVQFPYEFLGFSARDGQFPYEFIGGLRKFAV